MTTRIERLGDEMRAAYEESQRLDGYDLACTSQAYAGLSMAESQAHAQAAYVAARAAYEAATACLAPGTTDDRDLARIGTERRRADGLD